MPGLGDQRHLTFLKSYQRTFKWQFGTTKDAQALLEYITKKDYKTFFDANFWVTGLPD